MALLLLALLGLACSVPCEAFAVVAYVPEWRYAGLNWTAIAPHVTHVLLFSIEVAPDATLAALDRFPDPQTFMAARRSTWAHGAKLLICFGGNGRSNGFSTVVKSASLRAKFLDTLMVFLDRQQLDGVDYNWEYPQTPEEWNGLFSLIHETRARFAGSHREVMMDIYPDQENMLTPAVINDLDLVHTMTYDNMCVRPRSSPPCHHSTVQFAQQSIDNVKHHSSLPLSKLTLGVPFYARHGFSGDWKTYEELHKNNPDLAKETDEISDHYFNGYSTIYEKTKIAVKSGLAGVMIWELGQDVHPSQPLSLLRAISTAVEDYGRSISDAKLKPRTDL